MLHGWMRRVSKRLVLRRRKKKARHPPAFLLYMGSRLDIETGCRKVYIGEVYEWPKFHGSTGDDWAWRWQENFFWCACVCVRVSALSQTQTSMDTHQLLLYRAILLAHPDISKNPSKNVKKGLFVNSKLAHFSQNSNLPSKKIGVFWKLRILQTSIRGCILETPNTTKMSVRWCILKTHKQRRRLGTTVAGNTPTASFQTKIGKMQSAGCWLCRIVREAQGESIDGLAAKHAVKSTVQAAKEWQRPVGKTNVL